MKKLLSISLVLIFALSLSACGKTKTEKATKKTTEDYIDTMLEVSDEEVSDEEREVIKNALNNSDDFAQQIEEEMKQLPAMLQVATTYRDCLKDASSKKKAIKCYEKADKMANDLGIEEDEEFANEEFNADEEFGDWTDEEKEAIVSEMTESLKFMEQIVQ